MLLRVHKTPFSRALAELLWAEGQDPGKGWEFLEENCAVLVLGEILRAGCGRRAHAINMHSGDLETLVLMPSKTQSIRSIAWEPDSISSETKRNPIHFCLKTLFSLFRRI